MKRGGWLACAVFALALPAAVIAWRDLPGVEAGSFDPVSAVIGIAGLTVAVVSLGLALRAQRIADADVTATAKLLGGLVSNAESKARRQLLGGNDRTIDVGFDFEPAPAHNAAGAGTSGSLEHIVQYYRKLRPRRMVITGAAGSGKTVLAVELILGLLEGRSAEDPVPVRLSAAMLDTEQTGPDAVSQWLVDHLTSTFPLSVTQALSLVQAGMVLPVIDGLDEMDADQLPAFTSRAATAIRACNEYLHLRGKAGLVITCRVEQYESLESAHEWVRDAARVTLKPVTLTQTRGFLTKRTDDMARWEPVVKVLQSKKSVLANALSTPWRLTLAAAVYDERGPDGAYLRDPAFLTTSPMDSEDVIRDHLLSLFIPAVAAADDSHHPSDRVWRWLATLARYLHSNNPAAGQPGRVLAGRPLSGTDIVLHELWPIAGDRRPRIVQLVTMIAVVVGVAAYLLAHVPIGFTPRQVFGATVPPLCADTLIYHAWSHPWMTVLRPRNLRGMFSPARRFATIAGTVTGLLILGPVFGLMLVFTIHMSSKGWFVVMLLSGLAGGLGMSAQTDDSNPVGPRDVLRSGAIVGIALWIAIGLIAGFMNGHRLGSSIGLGLAGGVTVGVLTGLGCTIYFDREVALYIAMLVCTRVWTPRWLPWRLGSFLDWCTQAGLMRIAGAGYQFRHRELQDFLAAHPEPTIVP